MDIKDNILHGEKKLGSILKEPADTTAIIAAILRRDAEKYGVELDVSSSYITAAIIQNAVATQRKS